MRRACERVRSSPPRISERKDPPILMSERPSFWQRLFGRAGGSSLSPRQQKVSDYIIARMEKDVPFRQVLKEDYVRRNSSQEEIERIVSSPSSSRRQGTPRRDFRVGGVQALRAATFRE